jgi:hypothetical protein
MKTEEELNEQAIKILGNHWKPFGRPIPKTFPKIVGKFCSLYEEDANICMIAGYLYKQAERHYAFYYTEKAEKLYRFLML